jgi:hypothetical protein
MSRRCHPPRRATRLFRSRPFRGAARAGIGGLGGRIGSARTAQRLHKLVMKHRRMSTQRLIIRGVGSKHRGKRSGDLILRCGQDLRRRGRGGRAGRCNRRSMPVRIPQTLSSRTLVLHSETKTLKAPSRHTELGSPGFASAGISADSSETLHALNYCWKTFADSDSFDFVLWTLISPLGYALAGIAISPPDLRVSKFCDPRQMGQERLGGSPGRWS